MAKDVKMGIGFIIPAAAVVGFFISLFLNEFLISIIISIIGILAWFLYMLIMESNFPKQTGNMIILFGILLAIGVFTSFGIKQNIFGGYDLQNDGSIFSLIILFFSILTGLNFRKNSIDIKNLNARNGLSDSDRDLVMNAIKQTGDEKKISEDPKIIVVKQENKKEEKVEDFSASQATPDPYGMANNPYFAYPPDYYNNEEYEDEEYEDEEYEDEEYEDEEYEDEKN
mgnify:CR=1 FL=1